MITSNGRERSAWSDAVADQIRAERSRARLTQKELAERAGMPRITYVRLESGERVADTTQIARILRPLGIGMSTFMARVEESIAGKGDDL